MKERKYITKFLQCITEKNYALGNKYLRAILTEKLKTRIASAISTIHPF